MKLKKLRRNSQTVKARPNKDMLLHPYGAKETDIAIRHVGSLLSCRQHLPLINLCGGGESNPSAFLLDQISSMLKY